MNNPLFAVDIGGSKLICGVLTSSGEILDTYRADYAPGYTADDLFALVREGFERLRRHSCAVCAAAIPGLCDVRSGMWLYSPFSGIGNVPVAKKLNDITKLPTVVDNDVNISALAEKQFGCCTNVDDFLWITVSNGIGGGLVLDGKLYRGARMTAGEIGHVVVEEQTNRICGCGNRGCLESLASGASISAIYQERTGMRLPAKEIAELARRGNAEAIQVWSEAGFYIGRAAAHAVNLLGIDTIVLGGGAAQSFDLLENAAQKAIRRYVFSGANPDVKLLHSALGPYAALKGCAALAVTHQSII